MLRLSSQIIGLLLTFNLFAQSPHGDKLNIKCDVCHSPENWAFKGENSSFNHNQTGYPLVGNHITVDCKLCHVDLVFSNAKQTCLSCHKDMHQQTVGQDCERCHTPRSWIVQNITEIHQLSRFPLQGRHAQADCYQCHKSASLLRFDPMGTLCSDCHMKDYNASSQPSHILSKYPTDCFFCHSELGWQPAKFNHNINTTFPLKDGHLGVECISCHSKGYTSTSTLCVSCHQTIFNSTTNPSHTGAKFSTDCKICHSEVAWKPSSYNHNTATSFPLTGGHVGVECISCHSKTYVGTSTDCVSCHLINFNSTTNPNHVTAKFSTDCKTCHTTTAWSPATFDHNKSTTFPLTGSHIGVTCTSCHANGYSGTPTTCAGCHMTNYNTAKNPDHLAAKFPTSCETCHTVNNWVPSTFNHNTSTTFALSGAHIGVSCISCHTNGYTNIASTCVSCHLTNFNATVNPSHVQLKYSTDCKICHNSTAWSPSTFNHNTGTSFPLTGAHTSVACVTCHSSGYTAISTACVSCHLTNYNSTTNPIHSTAKFPTTCETCHTTSAWVPSTFNHNTSTTFALSGAHIGVSCNSCHSNGYTNISSTCVSCHLTNFNATTNPSHVQLKYSTDCKLCHTTTAWSPSTFNHNTSTSFPLTGAHTSVACVSCHTSGYTAISTTCVSCHLTNYNSTTNPVHSTAKFPNTCETCHSTTAWVPSTFNHNTSTTFPLTGAHISVSCANCHTTGYTQIPTTCVSCHMAKYNASTNPSHVAAKFPTTCETCHTSTAWTPSTFNHNTSTTFPLTDAHVGVSCISCHTAGYAGIPTTCVSCHLTNYNATTNPGHVAAKFSTDCKTCHSMVAWSPATFNHSTGTTFPLTGSHVGLTCISCHSGGYVGISTACVSCHQSAYNSTTNPAHATAKFPTNCESCHTTTVWTTSTFDHDTQYFKVYSGRHKGQWTLCSECHTNPANFAVFNCLLCHTHNQASMDSAHKGKTGYVYNSTNCFSCHPKV